MLSRLTGDRRFEAAARRALISLFNYKSAKDLFGQHINAATGTLYSLISFHVFDGNALLINSLLL